MRTATALLALALAATAAAQVSPPLNGDFLITPTPILTPWTTGASAVEGSSTSVGNSVARLVYAPCGYRAAHWHSTAWEVLTPVSPTLSLTSVMEQPSNGAGGAQLRTDIIAPGQSLTIPQGWLHYQFNDNCAELPAVLVWNQPSSGGTNNAPQMMAGLPLAYTDAAFVTPLPEPAGGPGTWVVDAGCAARCGLPTNGTSKKDALISKLEVAKGFIPSGEQVAAAKAAAMFGKGVKESVATGINNALVSAGANKTALG